MVENKPLSGLGSIVKNQRHMTGMELLPLLNIWEILKFQQLSKASYQFLLKYVNFKVLFEVWGVQLTDTQVEETKISTTRALQVALKCLMIKSIIENQHIIGKYAVVTGNVSIPDFKKLSNMSLQELKKLTITKVQWNAYFRTLGFTLNDSQSCKAGNENPNYSHIFDPAKRIT